jgi:hypothetical protein
MTAAEALESAKGLTFEKVWAMFQETDKQIKESAKKIDRQQEETGRQIKELSRETDRQIKELSKETDQYIAELSRNIADMSSSIGTWAEEMISANLLQKFTALGYTFTHGGPEKYWKNNRILAQVDILLENGDYAMPVEVRSVLAEKDVDEHLERIEKIRGLFDQRGDRRKLVGAVAGMSVAEEVKNYAQRKGLYVLVQSGDSVTVADAPENFKAREW